MRGNEFLDKMELVNAAYVEEADRQPVVKRSMWIKRGAVIAAAACLAIFAGTRFFLKDTPGNIEDLPMLSVSENYNAGMGFEGYGAYDVSELVSENPWNEGVELSTMPVFKNSITYDKKFHIASGANFEKMREVLLEAAGRLGLDTDTLTVIDNAPDEETKRKSIEGMKLAGIDVIPEGYFDPTMMMVETDNLKLEVDQSLTVTIRFNSAVALPEKYSFTHGEVYEGIAAVAQYLKNEYKALMNFDKPQMNISGGDYNIHNQQNYKIEFYDKGSSISEQIVNYNFNRVVFYGNEEGKLFLIRVYQPDLSDKAGDYPVISPQKAQELLENGSYITNVPYEMPGGEYVKKVELIYRTGVEEVYYMPYYRFYVELPEAEFEEIEGMKTYGAYYVPAISGEYISNMPVWDGSFN